MKIKSAFVDKDNLPAPHQGYNKGYESSDSMFTGFRSTFAAKKEWKWSVTFSLLAQLGCIKSEWYDWLQVECGSIIKSDHMEIPFKLMAILLKALKSEIS